MKRAILFFLAIVLVTLFFLAIVLVIAGFYFVKQPIPFSPIVGTSMNPALRTGDLITSEEIPIYLSGR